MAQKKRAKQRGIEWQLDYETWLRIWTDSGHFADRGQGTGKYVMGRKLDAGPYAEGNVEIIPHPQNSSDAARHNPRPTAFNVLHSTIGQGRGWCFVKNRYQVYACHKYVGVFKTAAEAETAYRDFVAARLTEVRA